jgi:cytochrome P450
MRRVYYRNSIVTRRHGFDRTRPYRQSTLIAAHIKARTCEPNGSDPRHDVLNMLLAARDDELIEMALTAARLIQQFDFSLEDNTTLPEPIVDLALKPKTRLRVPFTRRAP